MLKHLAPSPVRKIFFLFPTIEKMAATPNGVSQRSLFTTYRSPFTATVWLLGAIPEFIKLRVLRRWFSSSPPEHMDYMYTVLPLLFHQYPKMNKKYPDITRTNYPEKSVLFLLRPARTRELSLSPNRQY